MSRALAMASAVAPFAAVAGRVAGRLPGSAHESFPDCKLVYTVLRINMQHYREADRRARCLPPVLNLEWMATFIYNPHKLEGC